MSLQNYIFFLTLHSLGLELSIMELLNIIVTERVRSLDSNKMYFVTDSYSLVWVQMLKTLFT